MRCRSGKEQIFAFGIETEDFFYELPSGSQLPNQLTIGIVKIKVIKSVPLTLPDELTWVTGTKQHGRLRLDVTRVRFDKKLRLTLSGTGVVSYQSAGILSTVQFGQINAFRVGAPSDICQVFLA